ncbi:MAG: hypothetical protein BGN88_14605 [Clostridiales bacterium 43-6]|nr:MAG: hypothetical protein BGN88_14605 [Clostridiales bacterium 43-6]
MNVILPEEVKQCMNILRNAGFKAYLVGGCVRDLFMEKTPHDYDITTDASPTQVISLFEQVIETGLRHGTVTVILNHMPIEITRMRVDGEYKDGRHPETVRPTRNLYEDLSRRDFTINAMAFDGRSVTDLFRGQIDIEQKRIQTVGDPCLRFHEDALRIMRAFRFAAVLDFELDRETRTAALQLSPNLQKISVERIFTELEKALLGVRPSRLLPLLEYGALVFLGIGPPSSLVMLDRVAAVRELRFAALFYICGSDVEHVCNQLKIDKQLFRKSSFYLQLFRNVPTHKTAIKKLLSLYDSHTITLALDTAEILTGEEYSEAKQMLSDILLNREPYQIADLAIDGNDILHEGFQGKEVGFILCRLLGIVYENPEYNEKEKLLSLLHEKL